MDDFLASLAGLKEVGGWTIVVIIVFLILNDKLITKQRLLDERAEKEHYRAANEQLQAAFDKISDSTARTVILAEATHHALEGIQQMAVRVQQEDKP